MCSISVECSVTPTLSFSGKNIITASKKSCNWPVDSTQLLSVPLPASPERVVDISDVEELEGLFEEKRALIYLKRSQVIRCDYSLVRNGFNDTKKGAVLTYDKALTLIRDKKNRGRDAWLFADVEAERKAGKRAQNDEKNRKEADRLRYLAWERRPVWPERHCQCSKLAFGPSRNTELIAASP